MNRLKVNLAQSGYEIVIHDNFSEISNEIKPLWSGEKIIIITDDIVGKLYLCPLVSELSKICSVIYSFTLPNGEGSKSIETLNRIYDFMLSKRVDRSDLIVALGGGVVGDVAGYAAATYLRGIAFIQVPTTLLAQIDSSVGGKVAINYQGYKNMIGSYYQPLLVYINISVLKTLPEREFKCGLVEAVVHALIADASLLQYMHEYVKDVDTLKQCKIEEFIYRNCKIKAEIVEKDEKDKGIRKILNFGHTVGHAIEGLYGYEYKHGECVAIGIVAAFKLSVYFKLISEEKLCYIKAVLSSLGLPLHIDGLNWISVVKRIVFDKKALSDKVTFILPIDIGKVIDYEVSLDNLENIFSSYDI
ncbi:MAG: 3-dehydroquinate synthase [Firmicutes bacterium]|nr:3-dehydroquinate synthase [Bacillota bacterium]